MSARTVEELSDQLANDLIWRKKELAVLSGLISSASHDREAVLVRSLVAILYAHWEGFLKLAATAYLDFLTNRRLPYSELATNFVALGLQARIRDAATRTNLEELIAVIDTLRNAKLDGTRLSRLKINTESNLTTRVLQDITTSLGIEYAPFAMKKVIIDERLVRHRNAIAHGDYLPLNADEALDLKDQVLSLMEHFRNEVENSVAQSRYKRSP